MAETFNTNIILTPEQSKIMRKIVDEPVEPRRKLTSEEIESFEKIRSNFQKLLF